MERKYLNVRNILEIQNLNLILTTKFKTLLLMITSFGCSDGFAAVFSQFRIVHTYLYRLNFFFAYFIKLLGIISITIPNTIHIMTKLLNLNILFKRYMNTLITFLFLCLGILCYFFSYTKAEIIQSYVKISF